MFPTSKMVKAARKAIESMYIGACTIILQKELIDPKTRLTNFEDDIVEKNIPCRLSYSSISTVVESEYTEEKKQVITLFISPDIQIPPGSKLVITQNDTTNEYEQSGEPAVYSSHQEIVVNLFKGWA